MVQSHGLFLTKTHGIQLTLSRTEQQERAPDCFRSSLPQCKVVLTATALIGMSFEHRLAAGIGSKILCLRFQQWRELMSDCVAVIAKINQARRSPCWSYGAWRHRRRDQRRDP